MTQCHNVTMSEFHNKHFSSLYLELPEKGMQDVLIFSSLTALVSAREMEETKRAEHNRSHRLLIVGRDGTEVEKYCLFVSPYLSSSCFSKQIISKYNSDKEGKGYTEHH